MKIDNSIKGSGLAVNAGATSPRRSSAPAPEPAIAPSAEVQISSLSSLGVDGVLANAPVTNPARIAEIKQAIADGRFSVNAEKIANGLLDSVRQLLNKSGSGV